MRGETVVLMLLLSLFVDGTSEVKFVSTLLSVRDCKEERRIGIHACTPVLYGKSPSPECCYRVRVSHSECVCPVITPKLAALVNLNRAIRLVQGCGRTVPRHFKCGSITTP
ncbi:hypothetical protein GIB67_012293 [Kingdonia uniflora]|uniref:Bifunctional inhibitor/plant lipid transfer protein/seed storage helical domain-containing protein n=1 Tax=Kingdonia uniflora TaxID=39325 RepID=A0A7J7MVI5_9MAGN|nr:hypothetical protein GIB67_012293 [Kingdonia uniflora]